MQKFLNGPIGVSIALVVFCAAAFYAGDVYGNARGLSAGEWNGAQTAALAFTSGDLSNGELDACHHAMTDSGKAPHALHFAQLAAMTCARAASVEQTQPSFIASELYGLGAIVPTGGTLYAVDGHFGATAAGVAGIPHVVSHGAYSIRGNVVTFVRSDDGESIALAVRHDRMLGVVLQDEYGIAAAAPKAFAELAK